MNCTVGQNSGFIGEGGKPVRLSAVFARIQHQARARRRPLDGAAWSDGDQE